MYLFRERKNLTALKIRRQWPFVLPVKTDWIPNDVTES
jgi:hypothetical protein